MAQSHPAAGELERPVLFRFPAQRAADTRLYLLPRLVEATWRFRTPGLVVQRIVGFSRDQNEVYVLTPRGELVALDLAAGRSHTVDSNAVAAALGPTGMLYLVRRDLSVVAVSYRRLTGWPGKLARLPEAIWGAGLERLVAVGPAEGGGTGRWLLSISAGKPPVSQPIPPGPVAVSPWADVATVAVDSGLLVLDPSDTSRHRFVPLARPPQAVAFSPSGHRVYVLTATAELLALDRYSLDRVGRLKLPAPAGGLRVDPWGRFLLVQRAGADSAWVVDQAGLRLRGSLWAVWRDDLPAVASDGSIVAAQGEDVLVLRGDSLAVAGRVGSGARDRWLAAAWEIHQPLLQAAADTVPPPPPVGESGPEIYVQVSSTANQAWAEQAARDLRAAGLRASVLPPSNEEERFRVVLGPFPTREAAEATGRKLGRPFWIFTREAQEPPR